MPACDTNQGALIYAAGKTSQSDYPSNVRSNAEDEVQQYRVLLEERGCIHSR